MAETPAQRLKGARRETSDEGVFIEILSRLAVKSICSCKMVCKSWNGWMSDNFFAKKQLRQSRENPSFISCPSMDTMKFYSINPDSLELVSLNTIFPAERCHEDRMYMISSFNGLICCISDKDIDNEFCDLQIWICNPCTGETLFLPQGRPSYKVEPSVGVAYASDISDYTVFRIFCTGKKIPEERVSREYHFREGQILIEYRYALAYECEVYSSSTCSWKNIGPVPRVPMRAPLSPVRSSHIFAEGKIFWLVSLDEPGEILSVDLEGKFEVLKLPKYPSCFRYEEKITEEGTFLINLQGSLSLVALHPRYMDVWVRKNKGEKYKWVNVCRARTRIKDFEIVLAMTSSKNKILCMTETHWHIFDLDAKNWERKRGPPSGFLNPSVFPFTESLLTCNGGVKL